MHSIPLDEAQRTKTNPGVEISDLHSIFLNDDRGTKKNPDVGVPNLHSIFLDEIKRQRQTKMLECLVCIPSSWMTPEA